MASNLIGISVIVTLRNPPGTLVHGVVAAVDPQTATLTLRDVLFPATGHRIFDGYHLEGHAIKNIEVDSRQRTGPPRAQPQPPPQSHSHALYPSIDESQPAAVTTPAPHTTAPPFADPAILSIGKRGSATPTIHATPSLPQEAPATPIKHTTTTSAPLPKNTPPLVAVAQDRPIRKPSAATLEKPFSGLDITDAVETNSGDALTQEPSLMRRVSASKTRTGKPMDDHTATRAEDSFKRTRRGGKARKKEVAAQERRNAAELNNTSPEAPRRGKDNGWRKTPLLQDPDQTHVRTPGIIGGRVGLEAATASNRKSRRQRALEAKNGWATEDATDIQEMPEFDFAENLSKFDKQRVFQEIRNEDTTADEDRLVSFNRARPGTHGGKNLHPTENVLDTRRIRSNTDSSTDEGELSDLDSGRNSRRALSRASLKRIPTRQGIGIQDADAHMHSGPPSSLVTRVARSHIRAPYATSSHATGSPLPGRLTTPPDSPLLDTTPRSCLRLVTNNRKCHTISPGGMNAVEESAEDDFGLSEDIMAENAGRGIAEVALGAINPGGRRLARDNHNARPVIVVLTGNHRGGARAVAAARHLQARGPKVIVALLGYERNADWDKDIRRQVTLFKKLGGSVRAWPDTEDALKRLQAPPELIIDALLGRSKEFDALGDEDRRTVLSIVGWANKSRASVLAVETPSGVGGSTGEVAILEGEPLEVRAKYIVCLGAPRTGLLKALQNGSGRDPEWLIWIVDIGVNRPWKSAGVGGGKGIKFGEHWVVQARFVEGDDITVRA
ncbi:YjeF N-terminal domain-like protein [Westerdykella ornata]|uniref:Enhancer of mRNA-decapping protein 3 n=1 Tax=Westerdykella ornata TaxID=318751 RepID=A0A6A6JQV1_WESOR|nr:YjeF N-terminal domain-like protein [Westerdykella ornata]KAF2278645.1 YjeF N-terminal domain-like protein [Westerdykella ornata]